MKTRIFLVFFSLLFFTGISLFGWKLIDVDSGKNGYHKPVVKFGPSGMLYMVHKGGRSVWLNTYDGKELTLVGEVSANSANTAYEPFVFVDANEKVHIAWCEFNSGARSTHYVKYRTYDGSDWSNEIVLKTVNAHAVEDLRLTVDSKGNVFVVGSEEEGDNLVRAFMVSKYGDKLVHDSFSNKHAWVTADDQFVHIVWQGKHGAEYSIWYGKKENKADGNWLKKVAKTSHDSARPSIFKDDKGKIHIVYNHEAVVGTQSNGDPIIQREIWYFDSGDNGESFNKGQKLKGFGVTHFLDVSAANGVLYVAAQDGASQAGTGVLYNVNRGNGWSGFGMIPDTGRCKCQGSTVSPDGSVFVTAFTRAESSVHFTVEGDIKVEPAVDVKLTLNKAEKKVIKTLLFEKAKYNLTWTLNNNSNETIDKIEVFRREKGAASYALLDTVASAVSSYSDSKGIAISKEYEYLLKVYWTDSKGNKGWTDSDGNTERL